MLVHGTLVAIFQGADLWQMFFFGFAAMFVVTQMHGLNLSRLTRWLIGLGFAVAVIVVYNADWSQVNEVIRIPFIEYLVAFFMAGVVALGFWIRDRWQSRNQQPGRNLEPSLGDD